MCTPRGHPMTTLRHPYPSLKWPSESVKRLILTQYNKVGFKKCGDCGGGYRAVFRLD